MKRFAPLLALTLLASALYGGTNQAAVTIPVPEDDPFYKVPANIAQYANGDVVAPGTVRTRVWDGQTGGADRLQPLYPLGRVGEPADIAAAAAFLALFDCRCPIRCHSRSSAFSASTFSSPS